MTTGVSGHKRRDFFPDEPCPTRGNPARNPEVGVLNSDVVDVATCHIRQFGTSMRGDPPVIMSHINVHYIRTSSEQLQEGPTYSTLSNLSGPNCQKPKYLYQFA